RHRRTCCPAVAGPWRGGCCRCRIRARARGSARRPWSRFRDAPQAPRDGRDACAAADACRTAPPRTRRGFHRSSLQCIVPAMRVFMTGATDYIGGAVAAELRHHGHDVTALVRPESEARHLRDLGVVIVAGDVDSLPSLGDALNGYDTYVNTAFAPQHDRQTIDTLASRGGQFLYTAGVWAFSDTTTADETTPPDPLKISAWRVE